MAFSRRKTAIVGVYLTEQARALPKSCTQLEIEALKGALDDAGLKLTDVDGIMPTQGSVPPTGGTPFAFWAEQLGQKPLGITLSGNPAGTIGRAASLIAEGHAETVVMVSGGLSQGFTPAREAPTRAPRTGEWANTLWGGYTTPWYAMWAQRYMHEFGATSEQLAEVAVTARYHATLNPRSIMGSRGPLTVEDVINSRMISTPLHVLDCCLDNKGGYALVITTAERARDCKKKPVYILGGGEATYIDNYLNIDKPWLPPEGKAVRWATDRAFEMAGVTRNDIDVACLYDCFTITVVRNLEEMGFCKLGEGADYVQGGAIRLGGKLPVNPHGGLLSCSHNGSPGGMHVIEAVRQLRGNDVEPERQVQNARIGVALNQGGAVHGGAGTLILASD